MARKPRAGTAESAADAVVEAAAGYPEPPSPIELRDADRPFWDAILRARLPQQWARVDLVHAAALARAMADVEAQRTALELEGDTVTNEKTGAVRINPRHSLLEVLSRRTMSLTRILQLHAVAAIGPKSKLSAQKGDATNAAEVLDRPAGDDGLLARPMLQ